MNERVDELETAIKNAIALIRGRNARGALTILENALPQEGPDHD